TIPITHFSSVLLPLPLVPSSATVSAAPTVSVTPCSTLTAPYPASRPEMVRLLAKVRPHHIGVAHDIHRVAVGDLASGHKHDKPLREVHHRAHDMFDQDDRDALFV